ncbi:MAG: alpha/beta hydrolase [Chloroflexaceae bacterium]|nr:alpha/beta hydrolase [Chloroflexaceae bacterium]
MPFVELPRGKIFVAQRGAGSPPIVCIHGAGGLHQHWGAILRTLGDTTHTLLPDLPGHGRSDPPGCQRIVDYSNVIQQVMDALALDKVILAGHSMGGAIALQTALETPRRVRGLVLVATGAKLGVAPRFIEALEDTPDDGIDLIVDAAYSAYATLAMRKAGLAGFRSLNPQTYINDLHACHAFDIRERLSEVTCPILVIGGEDDQMAPPRFSHYLHEHLANSELVMLRHAGHMLPIEKPAEVGAAIRSWFVARYRNA